MSLINYMFGFFIGAYSVGLITFGFNTLSNSFMNLFAKSDKDECEIDLADTEPVPE